VVARGALSGCLALVLCACASLLDIGSLDVQENVSPDGSPGVDPGRDGGSSVSPDSGDPPPPPDPPPPKNLERSPEGTFTYAASDDGNSVGNEHLNGAGFGAYAATVSVEVKYVSGNNDCLDFAIDFRANYTETFRFCVRGPELVQTNVGRDQLFPLARVKVDAECRPGDVAFVESPQSAQSWVHDCTGTMSDTNTNGGTFTTKGVYQYKGEDDVPTAPPLKALHFYETRSMNGAQSGSYEADLWFTRGGQLVRFKRTIDMTYVSKEIGSAHYVEQEDMTLKTVK
jgi:hypothetical protein